MPNRPKLAVVAALVTLLGACASPSDPPPTPAPPTPTTAAATPTTVPAPAPAPQTVPTPTVSVDRLAPAGWVDLADVDPTIIVEIRYATAHNFVGRPVAGYLEGRCLLPQATARALANAQRAALARGYALKVYDCYRPTRATADFVAWRHTPDEAMRAEFFPRLTKAQVFSQGFVAGGRSNHSTGRAVDVTLVRLPAAAQPTFRPGEPLRACTAPAGERFADNSIDMGTGYDCFDALARTLDGAVSESARANRLLLRGLMTDAGFANYAGEWWHYDLPGPADYQDFPVARAALR